MKKSWLVAVMIAALGIMLGSASGVSAQQGPIVGGYGEASRTDPEVVSAARFAVRARTRQQGVPITLLSIERAELQVVAGLNYRLRMRVKVKNQTQDVTAVVYRNLRQRNSLSSWEIEENQAGRGRAASNSTIEQLVEALDVAYMNKALGRLDARRPYFRKVRFVIEHSISEEADDKGFAI